MDVYVDKNGFVHLRKSKNRFYVGQFLGKAEGAEKVEVLLSPKLSEQAHNALLNAKVERCSIKE